MNIGKWIHKWLKARPKASKKAWEKSETYSRKYCPAELTNCHDHTSGFRNTQKLYRIGAKLAPTNTWAEFGVGAGRSSRMLAQLLDDSGIFFLFDSWEGIPDDWVLSPSCTDHAGEYCFPKWETNDNRMRFIDGWYNETLPFDFQEQIGLVNIDCDVYSSTHTVLTGITEWIGRGTVLIFDELLGYQNYAQHEYRALTEWLEKTGNDIGWIGKERFAAIGIIT